MGWIARLLIAIGLMTGVYGGVGVAEARSGVPLRTCLLAAQPGWTPRGLFARPGSFDCAAPDNGLASGDYWVLSAPLPAAVPFMASVRTTSVWQRQVTLHVLYADGVILHAGFTSATTAPHLRLGAVIDLPLPQHDAARPVRLLWHVEGSAGVHGVVVGPRLTGHEERSRDDMGMVALNAAFGGLVLGLLLYNLALWRALRQPFQSAYCAMLLCLLLYSVSSSGWIEQLSGMDNNMRLRLNALSLAMVVISAMLFARSFFERQVFTGWLRRASSVVMAYLFVTTLLYATLAPWRIETLDLLMTGGYVLILALIPVTLVRAWRVGSIHVRLFAFAWGAPIALAGVRVAAALHLVRWNWWIDNSTVPAMALEACLSGLVIAARIRIISRERDEARRQEILARMLADVDPLTGLLNRRAFLSQAIGRAADQTLIVIDIDHFKLVNETIGHDGGDEVLRVVSRMLQHGHGPDVLVARLGGEEFAIVAPVGAIGSPALILERLRATRMPFDLAVTASIGSCSGPLINETDWKALYRCADRALFEAKAAGRDRVRHAPALACAA